MTRSRTVIAALCAASMAGPAVAGAQAPADAGGAAFGVPRLGAEPAALHGRMTTLKGVRPEAGARPVTVQRLVPATGWETLGVADADPSGAFALPWRAADVGRYELRTLVDGQTAPAQAQTARAGGDKAELVVYRPVKATWYGPGFFGNRTACGQRLRSTTRGVAHRTLPCGSVVEVTYGGRTVQAPVIDRGPFRTGVHYDLTQATAGDVGFDGLEVIGVLTVSRPAARAAR
jgi:rare lipoprotein A